MAKEWIRLPCNFYRGMVGYCEVSGWPSSGSFEPSMCIRGLNLSTRVRRYYSLALGRFTAVFILMTFCYI
jgi:hypothetical protein